MAARSGFISRYFANRTALLGTAIVAAIVVAAILASVAYPGDPLRSVADPELWPFLEAAHPLGTDALGRDIAAMMLHGAQTTILIGLIASMVASVIGILVGSVAGFYGGVVDSILMRFTELFQIIPNLVFLIALVSVFGPKIEVVILGIGFVSWTGMARLVRAEFLSLKNREFVLAARAQGMTDRRIIAFEILPNALPPAVVLASLIVGAAILYEASLSFLGLSDPAIASWGRLVGEGRSLIRTSWYISAIPGLGIMFAVLSVNLVGDALTDALNPRVHTPSETEQSDGEAVHPSENL